MSPIPYDPSRQSLFHPGDADDFFQLTSDHGLSDAALCAEMSRLAYVKDEARLETYLRRAGFQKDLALGYRSSGTQAFIASRPDETVKVVAFRGTELDDPSDLFSDADFVRTPWTDGSGRPIGEVHKGFADAFLERDVAARVKAHLDSASPAARMLVTGHSLGAALATLMASRTPSCHLYTFGSPRIGDASFVQAMRQTTHMRFVDCCDLVTRVPPDEFGYVHAGALRYIDRAGRVLDAPSEDLVNADRRKAVAWYLIRHAFLPGTVFSRELADHAPINYLSGVTGLRAAK